MAVDLSRELSAGRRAEVLKAISEPARWRIIERLAEQEQCVCHLVDDLGLPQPLVSHHLKVLRDAGIVESERFRQWSYYRLVPSVLSGVANELSGLAKSARGAGANRRPAC